MLNITHQQYSVLQTYLQPPQTVKNYFLELNINLNRNRFVIEACICLKTFTKNSLHLQQYLLRLMRSAKLTKVDHMTLSNIIKKHLQRDRVPFPSELRPFLLDREHRSRTTGINAHMLRNNKYEQGTQAN